jgi:predicted anti-sigma-YlaC factor YlaD
MTEWTCESVRECIPDIAGGRLGPAVMRAVGDHLGVCEGCREELGLARALFGSRPAVPPGLDRRIEAAVLRDRRAPRRRPWWGLTAAAVAALALGIGISSERIVDPFASFGLDALTEADATAAEDADVWISDDGLLAGAPALDVLSDEDLVELLDELAMSGAGGAV